MTRTTVTSDTCERTSTLPRSTFTHMKGYNDQSLLMISYVKYIFGNHPNHDLFLHLSIYTCVDYERGHSIFEAMGKVQSIPKGEMQKKEGHEVQQEDTTNWIFSSRLLDQRKGEGESECSRKGSDCGQKPNHLP